MMPMMNADSVYKIHTMSLNKLCNLQPCKINVFIYTYIIHLKRTKSKIIMFLVSSCSGLCTNHSSLAPFPLSIFRLNSKFDENSKHSSVKYTRPITTIFCTRHDSVIVVTCKISLWSVEYIRNYSILNVHRISNSIEICLVGRAPGVMSRMKIQLKQHQQAKFPLHLRDQQAFGLPPYTLN